MAVSTPRARTISAVLACGAQFVDGMRRLGRILPIRAVTFVTFAALIPQFASAQTSGHTMLQIPNPVDDTRRPISITVDYQADDLVFAAEMPKDWDYSIMIDWNQDGIWGAGPFNAQSVAMSRIDRVIGVEEKGKPCDQYIYGAYAESQDQVEASSGCRDDLFHARIDRSEPDADGLVTTRYVIRASDVFGDRADAHLAFEIWTGNQNYTYSSPRDPFILPRSPKAP